MYIYEIREMSKYPNLKASFAFSVSAAAAPSPLLRTVRTAHIHSGSESEFFGLDDSLISAEKRKFISRKV